MDAFLGFCSDPRKDFSLFVEEFAAASLDTATAAHKSMKESSSSSLWLSTKDTGRSEGGLGKVVDIIVPYMSFYESANFVSLRNPSSWLNKEVRNRYCDE
jgi:hypothetical protein